MDMHASRDQLPELQAFLGSFRVCFRRPEGAEALERYRTGLLVEQPKKNCDTIAQAVPGTSEQRFQEFLTNMPWDEEDLHRQLVQKMIREATLGDGELVFDDMGFPKQGKASVDIDRQHSGTLGNVGNCQIAATCCYTDPQAMWPVAVWARMDWKYALALDLTDPGREASVLSEFRQRLITGHAEHLLCRTMLTRFRDQGLLKAKGRQRTDSPHVMAAIQTLNRLECVGETLRHALNVLATAAPDWLRSWLPAVWFDRYSQRFAEYRLPPQKPTRDALAEQMGTDGRQLLGPSTIRARPPGCGSSQRSRPCGGCGCSSSTPPPRVSPCAGVVRLICPQRRW